MPQIDEPTLRRMAEGAPALLAVVDRAGRFTWANASWTRILGLTVESLMHRPMLDLVHPDDRRAAESAVATAPEAVFGAHHRARMLHADGSVRHVDWFLAPLAEGLVYARDVSETVVAERALARQVELLTLAEEIAGVGHWRLDLPTEQVQWSPQVYRIHGRDPAEYRPDLASAIDAYHPDDRERVSSLVAKAMRDGAAFQFELRVVRPTGEIRHVLSRGHCERGPDGRVSSIFGTFLDVTERDQLRDQLAREHRLATMGMLAAGVGHEINNPLMFASANVEALIEEVQGLAGGSPSGRWRAVMETLHEARTGLDRMKKIVRGLRAFARDDSAPAPTDLAAAIAISINMSAHELRQRATCVMEVGELPLVEADEARLTQVLVNLICNAAQAFREHAPLRNRVVVRAQALGDGRVAIDVADNGPGIPAEIRARIFEPFFTTKPVGIGTGLGLAISQSIIASFGGELRCESTEGVGTVFTVVLREAAEPAVPAAVTPLAIDEQASGEVVIIDDELSLANALQRYLRRDFPVRTFTDPRDAVAWLQAGGRADVILCDLMMPHLTGMELFGWLGAHRPELVDRVIFMSGGTTQDEIRDFLQQVDNERLEKPFELSHLRAMIRRALGRRS